MSRDSDVPGDWGDMMAEIDEVPDISVLAGFLGELRAMGDTPPPAPSAELALAFVPMRTTRLRRHRIALAVAAGGLAVAGSITTAAATGQLPSPAQRFVSNVINDVTPLHVDGPGPATSGPQSPLPASTPGRGSTPVAPTPSHGTAEPSEGRTGIQPEPDETADAQRTPGSSTPPRETSNPEPGDSSAPTSRESGEDRSRSSTRTASPTPTARPTPTGDN